MAVVLLILLGAILAPLPVRAQDYAVVSAASYLDSVSPDSWAAFFGPNLARTTTVAELGPDGQFPEMVGGVTIEVEGVLARIHFVSAGQVNFLMPPETPVDKLVSVILRSETTSLTQSVRVQSLSASPALFSRDSSGSGPGAILNGVTYAGEPFRVLTPENGGSDKRTRLSIFGTGFRFARNLGAVLAIPSGDQFAVDLEYFGPSPGIFGLDQANLVLPPELDLDLVARVSLRTDEFQSNEVTFKMEKTPGDQITLQELRLDKDVVIGGESVIGRVRLNGRAPVGGVRVLLREDSPLVSLPQGVTIPEGQIEAEFTVTTLAPSERRTVEIRAISASVELKTSLTIEVRNPIMITSVTLDPQIVLGGKDVIGTVRLRQTATSFVRVSLSSSDSDTARPRFETVDIIAGEISADFRILTALVESVKPVTITASIEGSQASNVLEVRPAVTISVQPESVIGGQPVTLELRLAEAAPITGALVEMVSDSISLIVPKNITVAAGQRVKTEVLQTTAVFAEQEVKLTALYQNTVAQTVVTLRPSASVTLESIKLNPTTVKGGQNVTGTVTLDGPAPTTGVFVTLRIAFPPGFGISSLPPSLTIPGGQTLANFSIKTTPVAVAETDTIIAEANSVKKTAALTINP